MIRVSKIPKNVSENTVRFFFENKWQSGGGDIEDLDYDLETQTAIITFEEDDVAERVLKRIPLLILGKIVDVELYIPNSPRPYLEELLPENLTECSSDFVLEEEEHDVNQPIKMIKVSKIPQNASEDTVWFFFENRRKSGGGDIEDLDYNPETHTAIITFEEEDEYC